MEHRHSNDDEVEAHYYHPTASRKRSPGATPAETAQAEAAAGRRRTVAVVAAVVLGVTLVYVLAQQPVFRNAVTAVLRFIEHDTGPVVGSALFVLLDVLCIVLMLPGTPLNLAAGYLFGFVRGSVVSVVGITLGAVTAFLLGRTVLHRWAEQKASSSPRLRIALDAMKQSAFQMVFLLRLSPVMPFPVLSYVLGASPALSFGTYTLATFAGILPSLLMVNHSTTPQDNTHTHNEEVWNGSDNGVLLHRAVLGLAQRDVVAGKQAERLGGQEWLATLDSHGHGCGGGCVHCCHHVVHRALFAPHLPSPRALHPAQHSTLVVANGQTQSECWQLCGTTTATSKSKNKSTSKSD